MRQTMFTEPKIVTNADLNTRAYVTFYYNNERVREYNGKSIRKSLHPNRAATLGERDEILRKLQFELHKALEIGEYKKSSDDNKSCSFVIKENNLEVTTRVILQEALSIKLQTDLAKTYKRNLRNIHTQFVAFLTDEELQNSLTSISTRRLNEFLAKFGSSGTYYMNKRRDLGVLLTTAGKLLETEIRAHKATDRRRSKACLHKPYDREQLKPLFNYLKTYNPKMYICCLLTYSCWLRPHEEVRLLKVANFVKDNTEIHLSGDHNKSGRIRVVYVPEYVRLEIEPILVGLDREDNIFSRCVKPHNDAYFNTQWKRAYDKMHRLGLIHKNQTIYSFRHTAAIDTYRRTKDVYLIQKLLGHSTIVVTLKYLRSLGELNSDDLRNAAPTID